MSIYRMMRATGDIMRLTRFRLQDATVLVVYARIGVPLAAELGYNDDGTSTLAMKAPMNLPEGWKLVVLQPYESARENGVLATSRASEVAALFQAMKGRNAAWELLAQFVRERNGREHGYAEFQRDPAAFPPISTEPNMLQNVGAVGKAMQELDKAVRARIDISLHWYAKAVNSIDSADAVVSMFVAWEALAFRDTNVGAMSDCLAEIYRCTPR